MRKPHYILILAVLVLLAGCVQKGAVKLDPVIEARFASMETNIVSMVEQKIDQSNQQRGLANFSGSGWVLVAGLAVVMVGYWLAKGGLYGVRVVQSKRVAKRLPNTIGKPGTGGDGNDRRARDSNLQTK